ncbi:hypothetical protein [Methylobacterium sp. SyP6R]|uniref:hypothetical protein n=1 Tax=Methylobacterium sp. SyP6R TaxID=2718876 RepID=UPI001F168F16|nr:hypothetical protein [Methylobacterium sp. SyP6R]MCF4125058.1 hypothetical protein [Methylobacterium sp. SyP6R]
MSTKQLYRFTAQAGPWVAGYRRDPAAATIALTPEEAELDLLAGTIVRDGTPTGPVVVPGAVVATDRVTAIRGAREHDFTVGELVEFLGETDLVDLFHRAVLGDVGPDRNTLAKVSAALDAAVVLLRAAIQTRAAAGELAGKAAAGDNADITRLSGLTTPLSISQGGTGAGTPTEVRTALGLPLVPGDPEFAQAMEAAWLAFVATLPVWDGVGPAPVRAGRAFRQSVGGPVLIAQ